MAPRRQAQPQETSSNSEQETNPERKGKSSGWRRPANTAFKQQRLKAWQPILTPKTVLPTLFLIGILFAPIGGLLIFGSGLVTEMTFDYTDCETLTPSPNASNPNFFPMPKYSYRLNAADSKITPQAAQYAFVQDPSSPDPSTQMQCIIQFEVVADLKPSLFLYYKLTNFYQNHRRYVKSLDSKQLKGQFVSASQLEKGGCKPLASINNTAIYPCGLIANSLFNDTFSNLTLVNTANGITGYSFSERGIAWPGEAKKYSSTPAYNLSQIVPPPNWLLRFPTGYNSSNFPDLRNDEHFQNWMRTAGLPTFSKLYGRNDKDTMVKGIYRLTANLNFPVKPYKGTKSVVISTVSWIGGKNAFLGWAYVASSGIFVLLAVIGLVGYLIKPRKLGDMSLLS